MKLRMKRKHYHTLRMLENPKDEIDQLADSTTEGASGRGDLQDYQVLWIN